MKKEMKVFVEKKDVIARLGNEVKSVAIYADNLSKEDAKSVAAFMKNAVATYDIHDCVGKTGVKNVLHNQLSFYEKLALQNTDEGYLFVEFANLLLCDEVWVFDNGYDNYVIGGRLDERLRDFERPIRFLAKTDDSWDFYQGRSMVRDENGDLQDNYYLIVDEIIYENHNATALRALSKDVLSDAEYGVASAGLMLTKQAEYVNLRGMVRGDEQLMVESNAMIRVGNEVVFDILGVDKCDDEMLRLYQAKLDFAQEDMSALREKYDV